MVCENVKYLYAILKNHILFKPVLNEINYLQGRKIKKFKFFSLRVLFLVFEWVKTLFLPLTLALFNIMLNKKRFHGYIYNENMYLDE